MRQDVGTYIIKFLKYFPVGITQNRYSVFLKIPVSDTVFFSTL